LKKPQIVSAKPPTGAPQSPRGSTEPQTAPAEPPIAKIGRNPLNDIVTVLRSNAITSSARGLRPQGDGKTLRPINMTIRLL
ncbi:hypothetical protein, partial [uncultured Alistipes sp.]|uniref:hypothetical protein n=1 Tax=uncultured Alistipes sp. TaxID=538949 RepID=UPI00260E148D